MTRPHKTPAVRGLSATGLAAAALMGGFAAFGASPAAALPACEMASFKAPADTTITSVKQVTSPVRYCRVDAYVTTNNPGPNKVHYMLALPENHNGRYLMNIPGGAAGYVPEPREQFLRLGYAESSTDKGTDRRDFTFRANEAMSLDWNHRGAHVASVSSQALAKAYYGGKRLYRYTMGCSGGGDGVMTEAEMYPADYDGYIAGASLTELPNGLGLWPALGQRMIKTPKAWISPDEYARIHEVILAKYDGSDGAIDGLIWDATKIRIDPGMFPFLSPEQYGTLKLISEGISHNGEILAPPFQLANVKRFPNFLTGLTPPPWTRAQQPSGFTVNTDGLSVTRPGFSYATTPDNYSDGATVRRLLDGNTPKFNHKNLARIKNSGSKLIMWTGNAEEAVPPLNYLSYAERADKHFGPAERAKFFRTFVLPGMHHCARGDNAPTDHLMKLLEASQNWVEKGVAPDFVILSNEVVARAAVGAQPAVAAQPATRTYRICVWPQRSVFAGGVANSQKLDVNDASNWSCQK